MNEVWDRAPDMAPDETINDRMDNFLEDENGLKNLNSLISPPSEHGYLPP